MAKVEGMKSKILKTKENNHIHYMEGGPVDGEALFFVHGWPDFWFGWRRQLEHFMAINAKKDETRKYRCIAVDVRGFGKSSRPREVNQYTWNKITEDFILLLDSLKIEQAVFIGHDWGGAAVWRMALQYPSRVRGVAAFCTPYRPRSKTYTPLEVVATMIPAFHYQVYFNKEGGNVAAKEFDSQKERFFKAIYRASDDRSGQFMKAGDSGFLVNHPANPTRSKLLSEEELRAYVDDYESNGGFWSTLKLYQTSRLNWEDEANLDPIVKPPALMVTAGKDFVLTPKLSEGMEQWVPKLTRGHVEDAAHWILLEQPKQCNTILTNWLHTLPKPTLSSKL